MTNREWLESMSDEDFAGLYIMWLVHDNSYFSPCSDKKYYDYESARKGEAEWLNQEHKEDLKNG